MRGKVAGLFFSTIFTARFFLEFLKQDQSYYVPSFHVLNMGQLLTIPFVGLGFYLLGQSVKSSQTFFMGNVWKKEQA